VGVPIPIFYCRDCSTPLATEETIAHVANIFEQEGSNAWVALEAEQLMPAGTVCSSCGGQQFRKETDIMDVWFDSGSSHMAVLEARPELSFPADLYLEGSDQYRGWYNSSLITSVTVRGESPYRGILSHGFTLDGEGRKMSKSIGNTVDPLKVCGSLGADILRLWVASVDYQEDVRISDNILTQTTEVYRKIRNTLRFFLGNLSDYNHKQDAVAFDAMNELDKYAVNRLHRMIERVTNAYDEYEFHVVYQAVHHFCAVEMSAFYLDIVKDRLYASRANDPARRASQTVLYEALTAVTKLIAPLLPHTAEEVWKFIPGVEGVSVQLADLPQVNKSVFDVEKDQLWGQFIELREDIFKALEQARQDKLIGNSLSACVHVYPNEAAYKLLQSFEPLDTLFIVSQVKVYAPGTAVPQSAVSFKQCSVNITVADGEKCERCWIVTTDIGHLAEHPTACKRCAEVLQAD
jgi:isoleucyl-tRNA synthetase